MEADDRALVFGRNPAPGLVAVEHEPGADRDAAVLFIRRDADRLDVETAPFEPFLWIEAPATLDGCPATARIEPLEGDGAFRALARFPTWAALQRAARWLQKTTGRTATDREAPYVLINDPVQQFLMDSGRTIGHGLAYHDFRRLQLDIETFTGEGFEFPNPERESDRLLAIGLSDSTGWQELIDGSRMDEAAMLRRLVEAVGERDPDVIEGHNVFAFDLDYLLRRAALRGIELRLGRGGRPIATRPGRFTAAERTTSYPRADVYGRTVLDTYFLAQLYDVSHRALPSLGLKAIARHFGFAREDRELIEGGEIGRTFLTDPARVLRYLAGDLHETAELAVRLAPVHAAQARMVPMSLQNVALRGTAAKIDAMLLREYLAQRAAIPRPNEPQSFEGGLTEMFESGVIRNVHHCDVRSLYPSIMLVDRVVPAGDTLGVFPRLLARLREVRLEALRRMKTAAEERQRAADDALQSSFKILINSFYGYLGFEAARFNDFGAAARVASRGRELLQAMVRAIRENGGRPIEIDTDGVYFVPPDGDAARLEEFRDRVRSVLPEGVELEFDAAYEAMFSYRRKNYAVRAANGEIVITGAALRSRGLEPYLRDFIRDWIELRLAGRDEELDGLAQRYRRALLRREFPIQKLARTQQLTLSPEAYAARRNAGGRARDAACELALASGRPYRAGDAVSFYVTGEKKSVPIHSHARLVGDADPNHRDENVAYYVARLDELVERLRAVGMEEDEPAEPAAARGRPRPRRKGAP